LAYPLRLRYRPWVTEAFSFLSDLNQIPGLRAAWVGRIPGLPILGDRDDAMNLLRPHHEQAVAHFAGAGAPLWRAEQVHGNAVATVPCREQVTAPDGLPVVPGVDGLITLTPGIVLAIYVADCGAIWLADRKTGAIGLLHSGKKGTESNILGAAIEQMNRNFGSCPDDVTAVLGPCIRPPDYEVDFAKQIEKQAMSAGVGSFHDCGRNTAADLGEFYSYRREMGETGRMMAMITRDFLP
jgi:copper oxidase (laccase) domain-containing protein